MDERSTGEPDAAVNGRGRGGFVRNFTLVAPAPVTELGRSPNFHIQQPYGTIRLSLW